MTERFQRHARTVSLLTLLSRVTGVARDAALSRVFGAGAVTDAFFFAFLVPNLFRRLFGEGALSAAFLPVFTTLDRDDPDTARRLASVVIGATAAGLGVVVVVAEVLLAILARTTSGDHLALRLTMIMLPYMPLVCLVALLGAMLQVRGRFGPTAAAPILLNGCLIAVTVGGAQWFGSVEAHVGAVAASVVVAGLLQVAWSLAALGRGWWHLERTGAVRGAVRRVVAQAGPMILGLGVLQINTLFDGVIASYPQLFGPTIFGHAYPLEEGAMAAVSFAQRLYQFPLGVFGIAVATAIFPALAREAANVEGFTSIVRRGLRLVVFIGLPASVGLVVVREPLAAVVLQGGDFTAEDTARVARVLLGYAPAIWAYSMMHVLTRAFYARGESKTPVKVAIAVVALNLALNCTLIWTPLREAGLGWSTAFCALVQVVALLVLLGRRAGPIAGADVARSWGRTVVASAIMGLCVWGATHAVPRGDEMAWIDHLVALAVPVVVGLAVYAGLAAVIARDELRWAVGR